MAILHTHIIDMVVCGRIDVPREHSFSYINIVLNTLVKVDGVTFNYSA